MRAVIKEDVLKKGCTQESCNKRECTKEGMYYREPLQIVDNITYKNTSHVSRHSFGS
jgi:hypothetical protein